MGANTATLEGAIAMRGTTGTAGEIDVVGVVDATVETQPLSLWCRLRRTRRARETVIEIYTEGATTPFAIVHPVGEEHAAAVHDLVLGLVEATNSRIERGSRKGEL